MAIAEGQRPHYETPERMEAAAELGRVLLGNPDKIKGKFLNYLAYHLTGQRDNRGLFRLPGTGDKTGFEVAQIAVDAANVLNSHDWEILPGPQEKGRFLLTPGYHANVRIISSFLSGKSVEQVSYELRQRGRDVTTPVLEMIRSDLSPFIVAKPVKESKELLPDDIFSFKPDKDIPAEVYLPLWEAALAEAQRNTATYGGINADILYPQLRKDLPINGREYQKAEIVPEEDQELNLRMPSVWYYNTGQENILTALYYVELQARPYQRFKKDNADLRKELGIVGMVEIHELKKLEQFAENEGYRVFGTPYDLVITANAISKGITPIYLENDSGFKDFQTSVFKSWAIDQGVTLEKVRYQLDCLEPKAKEAMVLHMIKNHWESVLVPRGWQVGDQEMILMDPQFSYGSEGRLSTDRKPSIVFVGGNGDVNYYDSHPMVYLSRNMELAAKLYPSDTRLIAPAFKDKQGNVFLAKVKKEPRIRFPIDALVLAMLTIREIGSKQAYNDLRSRYEEVVK